MQTLRAPETCSWADGVGGESAHLILSRLSFMKCLQSVWQQSLSVVLFHMYRILIEVEPFFRDTYWLLCMCLFYFVDYWSMALIDDSTVQMVLPYMTSA